MTTDPFLQPEDASASAAIAAIAEDLGMFDDWMDRYQFIIEMGRKLPPFPSEWQNDSHRVPGCQSKVWMEAVERDGRLFFAQCASVQHGCRHATEVMRRSSGTRAGCRC